jgi:LysR family transcriptional regulator, low CO2-responsive transcriptional regulator
MATGMSGKDPALPQIMLKSELPGHLIRHATLRQLQVFEAIVRLGSFTQAAEELFLTQPTVSIQIKKLSDAVGMPLFEQIGRKVFPTEVGHELYDTCREILGSLTNLEMKLADLHGLKRGRLRLAVITTAQYLAPSILGQFARKYPHVELSLEVSNYDRVLARLANNDDDLYIIGHVPDQLTDVAVYPFAPNPLVVMARRDHPLVGKRNIPIQRLAREYFLMREPGSGIREATLKLFEQHGMQPKIRMDLGSNEAIKQAVIGGLGIAVLSLHTLSAEGTCGPIALLDVAEFPILRQWHIVHPRRKVLSIIAKTFLEFAIQDEARVRAHIDEMMADFQHNLNR